MKQYLEQYYRNYPKSAIQDFIKFVYQWSYGPNHFFKESNQPLINLESEISQLKTTNPEENLYDYVGPNYVRINLRPYLQEKLSIKDLSEQFFASASSSNNNQTLFFEQLMVLKNYLKEIFSSSSVDEFFENYLTAGCPALSHSEVYHHAYQPSYRLIDSGLLTQTLKLKQIEHFLKRFPTNELSIIAIDGSAASGKTTIAEALAKNNKITLVHADDFFDESNEEIGINSSRILNEVIKPSKLGKPLTYQRYNCHKDEFREARIKSLTNILIIEGVFSANLLLRKYYQAIIYFEISEEEQLRRLQIRSHKLLPQFENKWLPRERRYFLKENVYSAADLIV